MSLIKTIIDNKLKDVIPTICYTSELHSELLSINGLTPFLAHNSSQRSQMFSSHVSQRPPLEHATPRGILTGVEIELAKYTFKTMMPEDGRIVQIIPRYTNSSAKDSIRMNPESLVIYESEKTGEFGCFYINYFKQYHSYFGFKNKMNPEGMSKLYKDSFIEKDTVFCDTPCVTEEGDYAFGINANMALLSLPATAEDGVILSESFAEKLKYRIYETRVVEFGKKSFPLNLYGTPEVYKAFPDIGDKVRPDNIIAALREYDSSIAPCSMSIYDCMEIDYMFDKCTFSRDGVGTVVDIRVFHDASTQSICPTGMDDMLQKYVIGKNTFYRNVLQVHDQLRKACKSRTGSEDQLKYTRQFHTLVVEALAMIEVANGKPHSTPVTGDRVKQKINLVRKKESVDDYRVEFVIEYLMPVGIGNKIAGTCGDKGVVVKVVPDADMPTDKEGYRADICMDPDSTIARQNFGRLYEKYFNAVRRNVRDRMRDMVKSILPASVSHNKEKGFSYKGVIESLGLSYPDQYAKLVEYLGALFALVSEKQYESFITLSLVDQIDYISDALTDEVRLFMPNNNNRDNKKLVMLINSMPEYRPLYDTVTYRGLDGKMVETVEKCEISELYIMLLEKIADDWSAVASGNLNSFGVLTKVNTSDKYNLPYKNSPTKLFSETESRLYVSYVGEQFVAEMMDRNNNPLTHKAVVKSILEADKPSNIKKNVDRSVYLFGNTRSIQVMRHIQLCSGFRLVYEPEDECVTNLLGKSKRLY